MRNLISLTLMAWLAGLCSMSQAIETEASLPLSALMSHLGSKDPVSAASSPISDTSANDPSRFLTNAFFRAKSADPLYRAAIAEYKANLRSAQASGAAYYPQLKVSSAQLENEAGSRRDSVSLIQPLVSASKWATFQERAPKEKRADANLIVKEGDLAIGLFAAFSDYVLARESFEQNKKRLEALQKQLQASKALFKKGQGTLTDVRDSEVRALQAKSEELRLKGEIAAANRALESITGEPQRVPLLNLTGSAAFKSVNAGIPRHINAEIELAEQDARLAELGVTKAKAAWIPELNIAFTKTKIGSVNNDFMGLAWSMPLQVGNFYSLGEAEAKAVQAKEEAADKERIVRLESDRLLMLVEFGVSEVPMRRAAVEAAEMSVVANEKSFRGGVKTVLEVLNSIETLYSVKTEHAAAIVKLADNLLRLRLNQGYAAEDSLNETQRLLFNWSN